MIRNLSIALIMAMSPVMIQAQVPPGGYGRVCGLVQGRYDTYTGCWLNDKVFF